jgi:hypothetical protein
MRETCVNILMVKGDMSNPRLWALWLMILLGGCSASMNPGGTYSSDRIPHSFHLNADSTYDYRYKFELAYLFSSGTWRKSGKNRIVLSSYTRSKVLPLKVQELPAGGSEQDNLFSVSLNMPDADKKYYQCMVLVNDALYKKTSCDSFSDVRVSIPVKSIFFKLSADPRMPARFLDTLSTEKLMPASSMGNKDKIDIVYNDSLFNYRVFNNEEVKVSGKGLKFYDLKRGRWQYIPKR